MLVRLVLGLLALLLTFDVVVGERGNGNLKLALAYGISRRCLLLGKILGALLALSGPLVLSVMLSVSILHFHGDVILGAVQWSRLVGLTVAYLAYLGIMLLLGILLSLYAHSSSAALVMSLLAWLLIVFLIPQSAVAIAAGLSGTGCDPQELAKSLKALREQQGRELEEATEAQQPLFDDTAHYSPVWEQEEKRVKMRLGSGLYYDARAEYYAVETKLGRLYAQRVYDQHRICAAVMERVERKANLLATLSPAFLLERLAAALAGTSVADYDAFFADCREYRMQLIKYLEELGAFSSWRWFTDETTPHPWTAMVGQPDPSKVSEEELGRLKARYVSGEVQAEVERLKILYDQDPTRHLNFEDLPKPERKVQSLSQALRRVRPEILCSLLFNIVFLGLVFRGFERYELG